MYKIKRKSVRIGCGRAAVTGNENSTATVVLVPETY